MKASFLFKIAIFIGVLGCGLVLFDLQVTPFLKRLVTQIQETSSAGKKPELVQSTQPEIPKAIPFQKVAEASIGKKDAPPVIATPTKKISAPEDKDTTLVKIVSQPEGGKVSFNGKVVGITPMEARLSIIKETQVDISLEGYASVSRKVKPQPNKRIRYHFSLEPLQKARRVHYRLKDKYDQIDSTDALVIQDRPVEPPKKVQVKAALAKQSIAHEKLSLEPTTVAEDLYAVQVASLRDKSEATYRAALYESLGYKTYVCMVEEASSGNWYRVRIGNLKSKKDAQSLAARLKRDDPSESPWIVRESDLCPKINR